MSSSRNTATRPMTITSEAIGKTARIYVAGHRGLVGSALVRQLQAAGYSNLILRTREELNLLDGQAVENFFNQQSPEIVFLAAAKVGGIVANSTYPAEFIFQNLQIQNNIIDQAHKSGVRRLIFLGSSCIYPRDCPQPIKEEYLLTGPLEASNRAYAIAKIAGIELCRAYNQQYGTRFLAVMPTNLFGDNDNYALTTSHVLQALIRKMHEARESGASEVEIWGSGTPRREFLFSDDAADACIFLMNLPDEKFESLTSDETNPPLINVGAGKDLTILELAELVKGIVGFEGKLVFDTSKPDGTPRKLLDISRLTALGWRHKVSLREGIQRSYSHFLSEVDGVKPTTES